MESSGVMSARKALKPDVRQLVLAQFCGAAVIAVIGGLCFGAVLGYSLLLGGLISAVPNAYFIYKVFSCTGARQRRQVTRNFYRGEAGKFLMTALLFALVFGLVQPLEPLALFAGFVLVQAINWFAPFLLKF